MNIKKLLYLVPFALMVISCSKDKDPDIPEDTNNAPQIEAQQFSVIESITASQNIGTVKATDKDGDPLTYSIKTNDNNLFQISSTGLLRLASGKVLNHANNPVHTISVEVNDGEEVASATITINVSEDISKSADSFITTWETTASGESITIGTHPDYSYDFTISWGDGQVENVTSENPTHTYETAGTYTVAIKGTFPAFYNEGNESMDKMISIEQWGTTAWQTMEYAFLNAINMTYSATDEPNLTGVQSMIGMFLGAAKFNGDIGSWDVHNITEMGSAFYGASSFNRSLNDWDVTNVVNMEIMFYQATAFNGDISLWNVSNVTFMAYMFGKAKSFNADISNWKVDNVKNMIGMFAEAKAFNADISGWNVSNVTNMAEMFAITDAFNSDISGWNVSNVENMSAIFYGATAFNQNLGAWNIAGCTDLTNMFDQSGMSPENYSTTLDGWISNGKTVQQGVSLGADNINFCNGSPGEQARDYLINTAAWTITDAGGVDCP